MCRLVAPILSAFALVAVSACASFRSTESETLVRFLPQDNALLVLELQHGIESEGDSPAAVQLAIDALCAVDRGARIYPPGGGLVNIDFDSIDEGSAPDAARLDALREFADAVHVEDRGLFLDEQGRLSFFRLTRLENFDRLIVIVNEWINREVSEPEKGERPFRPDFPIFDEASWKLVQDAARSRHSWLGLENNGIVLDVPMTEANAALCLSEIVSEGRKSEDDAVALQFFEQLSGVSIGGGHARLRFCGGFKPVLRFVDRARNQDYDDSVKRRLVELGVELGGPDAPARARATLEAPTPGQPK